MSGCHATLVEVVVVYRAWCPTHGAVGPLRESERDANDDADDHYHDHQRVPDRGTK